MALRSRALMVASALIAGIFTFSGVESSAAGATTFKPVADAYVDGQSPSANFGTRARLRANATPDARSYLRFKVANVSGPVTSAKLELYSLTSSAGFEVRSAPGGWGEKTVTYRSAPAAGAVVATSGPVAANTWTSLDVTSQVPGNQIVNLVISTAGAKVDFASRENTNSSPRLRVNAGTTSTTTTTTTGGSSTTTTTAPTGGDPVLVGAGDIAQCSSAGDEATAKLLDGIPGTVFTVGDNAYPNGSAADFSNCYQPSWGRHKGRTRPAVGNHEYHQAGASAYFQYFGAAAGSAGKGWYSYDVGAWHIVVLNSNCSVVACDPASPQGQWLRADLAAHPAVCTAAVYHHPRFSSGNHGSDPKVQPLWGMLVDNGVDLALNGHEHSYERFAPMDGGGRANPAGMREFVVGTGGAAFKAFNATQPNSEVRKANSAGVLKLTLHNGSYDWNFIATAGDAFRDSGRGTCH